jgi:SAM-dependent methyltransferase
VTDHGRSFGAAAARYDEFRPSYPAAAVTWALGERPLRVADIGAGTGILSRILRQLGHDVVAIEPDDLMRAQLATTSPDLTALAGAAEDIPLPDGSVDAVVAGQAYHWFDRERAHPQIARVLRPGGVFAALWNFADMETAWTLRFTEIVDGREATVRSKEKPDFGSGFGPVEQAEFRHEMPMTKERLVALATTRSPYLVASPADRQAMIAAVRALVDDLADTFPMPQITRVRRAYAV